LWALYISVNSCKRKTTSDKTTENHQTLKKKIKSNTRSTLHRIREDLHEQLGVLLKRLLGFWFFVFHKKMDQGRRGELNKR